MTLPYSHNGKNSNKFLALGLTFGDSLSIRLNLGDIFSRKKDENSVEALALYAC